MEYYRQAKNLFNTVNTSVKTFSGGKVDLEQVGKNVATNAANSLISKGKTKFQSMLGRKGSKMNSTARKFAQMGVDLFHQAPKHLQQASSLLDTTTHALMSSELGHTRFGSKLQDFNTKAQASFNVIQDRHEMVAGQLSQSNIQMKLGNTLDSLQNMTGGAVNLGNVKKRAFSAISQLPSSDYE